MYLNLSATEINERIADLDEALERLEYLIENANDMRSYADDEASWDALNDDIRSLDFQWNDVNTLKTDLINMIK